MKKGNSYTKKVDLPPGSLVYTGTKVVRKPEISIITYSKTNFAHENILEDEGIKEALTRLRETDTLWLNIKGISSPKLVEVVGNEFNLHPLLLEDILNPIQRPKFEDYENYLFFVLKRIEWNEINSKLSTEQVSLILISQKLITLQEQKDNMFLPIEQRLETAKGKIRTSDTTYLMYSVMDLVVDRYFIVLERISEMIEQIEGDIYQNPDSSIGNRIHQLSQELRLFKKSIWPLREALNNLIRSENSLITGSNSHYIRDLNDHLYQVLDSIESYRELLSSLLDLYLSMISNKTNDIMKVLTIIATIFIPLTFIAGVYGMNFDFMPELLSPWGYPVVWVVMILISVGLLRYFRKKKWI